MRSGKVYYNNYLAGIISETNEGEYVFQYDEQFVANHPEKHYPRLPNNAVPIRTIVAPS